MARQRREILATGSPVRPRSLTIDALAEAWLRHKESDVRAGNLRAVTLNSSYKAALTTVRHHLGHRQAAEVTTADVRQLLNTLKTDGGVRGRPLGNSSLTKALLSLRLIFSWATEQGWLAYNPASTVRTPRESPGGQNRTSSAQSRDRATTWDVNEYARFRDHVDVQFADGSSRSVAEPWVRSAVRLTLCGLRRSEVLGLDWQAVDLAEGRVSIRASRVKTGSGNSTQVGGPKTEESARTVPIETIAPGTRAALRSLWLAQGRPRTGLVIVDALSNPVQPDAYSRRFHSLATEAGVAPLRAIHNLRHTIATALHEAGVPPVEAASLLGHSVPTHLAFYVPTGDDHAERAAARAGAIFNAAADAQTGL